MSVFERIASELAYARGGLAILRRLAPVAKATNRTLPDVADEWLDKWADRPALLSARERFSFGDYVGRANRYARWALQNDLAKGECVALLMPNRPEFLAIWLGIARAGGVTALLNTNLTHHTLAHSINIVQPKHVIIAAELLDAFESAVPHLAGTPRVWVHGSPNRHYLRVDEAIEDLSPARLAARERPALTIEDRCLYIYTSGTTGLPKAANINHYRVQAIMNGYSALTAAAAADRIYVAQPLYHSSGGVLAPGITLTVGGSCFIAEKFSVSRFWDDVVANDCTMFQYIGELCRYLLNSPPNPNETKHKLRLINGNGLRPDIWMDFKTRFKIPRILEWYAATEGNVALFNLDNKPGAVGRIPKWLAHRFETKLVRFDMEHEKPIRTADGRCIECAPDEIGEAVGRIVIDPAKPAQRFDGYADGKETEKKILRDVFEPGDAWFRTGDLLRKDKLGYFYFIDRIGDTFRWKGENVATSQVAETITAVPGIRECNVYGIALPGYDGRAGMAAIVADAGLDLDQLARHVVAELPDYARPVFVRLRSELDTTGTFKLKKMDLVADGIDAERSADPIYVLDPGARRYRALDAALRAEIQSGETRL